MPKHCILTFQKGKNPSWFCVLFFFLPEQCYPKNPTGRAAQLTSPHQYCFKVRTERKESANCHCRKTKISQHGQNQLCLFLHQQSQLEPRLWHCTGERQKDHSWNSCSDGLGAASRKKKSALSPEWSNPGRA